MAIPEICDPSRWDGSGAKIAQRVVNRPRIDPWSVYPSILTTATPLCERMLHDLSDRDIPGEIIAIEGTDGAGKSTALQALGEVFFRMGVPYYLFLNHDKGRPVLTNNYDNPVCPIAILELPPTTCPNSRACPNHQTWLSAGHQRQESPYWASVMQSKEEMIEKTGWEMEIDRALHTAEFLAQARTVLPIILRKFPIILADRYTLSKIAYARSVLHGKESFAELMLKNASGIPSPACTFLLTIPADKAIERIEQRYKEGGSAVDWRENRDFIEVSGEWMRYLATHDSFFTPTYVIDTRKTPEQVRDQMVNHLIDLGIITTVTSLNDDLYHYAYVDRGF